LPIEKAPLAVENHHSTRRSLTLDVSQHPSVIQLQVKQVATGVHVDGGNTVHWGLIYLNGKPPDKKNVEIALREAGFDFVHNVLTQVAFVWTDHSE
jgi:hypothetical protein